MKRVIKYLITCIIVFLLVLISDYIYKTYIEKKEPDVVILNKDEMSYVKLIADTYEFDKEFIYWIKDNYDVDYRMLYNELLKNDNIYDSKLWHKYFNNSYYALLELYKGIDNRNDITYIENKDIASISFAGDVSLADNWEIMPYYESRKQGVYGILSKDTVKYMNETDFMIINSEFCFSDRGEPLKSKLYTFRANPKNISIYNEMGIDLATLANNHVYDYGHFAFLDTLKTFKEAKMPYIGAGENIKEAANAYYLIINGYKIAFLNASRAEKYILTPGATNTSEGIFRVYDNRYLKTRIKEESKNNDYVVVLIHWGTEDTHKLEDIQKTTGREYIDAGAFMVVGTHAHVLQGMEFYKDNLIAYNLGDYIFSKGTKDTGIFTWELSNNGDSTYKFIPGIQKNNKTSIVYNDSAALVYDRMTNWSVNAKFKHDGSIVKE